MMHHSNDPLRRSFPAACYLDDSGTHENSRLAVIGGPVMVKEQFTAFHLGWDTVLSRHEITETIHMREFTKPEGKFAYLTEDQRRALFSDLVHEIKQNTANSVSASVLEQDFEEFFPRAKFKRLFGPAPLAFIWCIVINLTLAENAPSMPKVSYLVAESDNPAQMLEAHAFMRDYAESREDGGELIGSIAFDTPANVYALQAADMIAWSNRRKQLKIPFDRGFEPLERLTRHVGTGNRKSLHLHLAATRESTRELAGIINAEFPNPPKIGTIKLTFESS